jgi:3-hydroxyisobutyrate dehydrogenase-like beta-hydroxyacid dehydrogenase
MTQRLCEAGWQVVGYDLDPVRRDGLQVAGGVVAASTADVVRRCLRILLSLPTSDVVASVLSEVAAELRPGQIVVDTTTGDPQRSEQQAAELARRDVAYLDPTVAGSSAEARRGAVVLMCGGDRRAFEACTDLFAALAERCFHVGGPGAGARTKLVVNLVLGLNRAALAEGLSLARRLGLDAAATLDVLSSGAAYSRAMDLKGTKMLAGEFSPQARLSQHLKDVRLILAAGERVDARLPLSTLHCQLLEGLETQGLGDRDNSAIIKAFE